MFYKIYKNRTPNEKNSGVIRKIKTSTGFGTSGATVEDHRGIQDLLSGIIKWLKERKYKNAVLEKSDMAFYVCRKILSAQIENASREFGMSLMRK